MRKALTLAESFLLMAALHLIRILSENAVRPLLPDTDFLRRMTTMASMLLLSGAVILYGRIRKTPLSFFPGTFSRRYLLATCLAALLIISSPQNFTGGYRAILLTVYGSIVTPVFEELVFRGYLWNRLKCAVRSEIAVYAWSVLLFTVWHLGYMWQPMLAGNWVVVLWKLAAGLGYGLVLGWVRLKTGNAYATALVHGVINVFMI